MLFFSQPRLKNLKFLRAAKSQTLPLLSAPALGRLLPALGAMGHKPALGFAPKGTAGCSPSAAGDSRCSQSILLSLLGVCTPSLLLPCSPGAEQRCQGDKGLRLGAAIPCSCGLAENYCSAGEENNILFTVSPGTRLRAEQVLTHRLRRGAEMQIPAASSPRRWQSPAALPAPVLASLPTLSLLVVPMDQKCDFLPPGTSGSL